MGQTQNNRKRLINLTRGVTQNYCISYCVDVKGNITILGGYETDAADGKDFFMVSATEDYVWLYDKWNNGGDFIRREQEAAKNTPREAVVNAYLQFRAQHPHDGYGITSALINEDSNPDRRAERDDIADVKLELKRRNRQYIAELYGETLPIDYDFRAEYDKAQNMASHKTI